MNGNKIIEDQFGLCWYNAVDLCHP